MIRVFALILFTLCIGNVVGCATSHQPAPGHETRQFVEPPDRGSAVARAALDMLGTPFRYGGNNRDGLDCSGLVQLAHAKVGLKIPRTAATQFAAAKSISSDPRVGDILFFRINGRIAHNGIYIGDDRFIHAPSSGKNVSITRIDNPYFKNRLAGIRRFR